MSLIVGLRLEALDVLFFRDGRPFTPAGRGTSGLPAPHTLAGALRTELLRQAGSDFDRLRGHASFAEAVRAACPEEFHALGNVAVRGPWLARLGSDWPGGFEVLVPVPAVLHVRKKQEDGKLLRLRPLPPGERLPGWRSEEQHGLRPLWLKERDPTEPATGFLTSEGLRAFLSGQDVPARQVVKPAALFEHDHRTGIGIDPDRLSAQESLIYGASFLALGRDVRLYAELALPDEGLRRLLDGLSVLPLGGEGRRVRVEVLPRPFEWPHAAAPGKPLLLLTTPGLFAGRWRPGWLQAPPLAAAAVPGAVAVSGWDLSRGGPRPTRFAAAAGSVYFLDGPADALPPDSLCDDPEDWRRGWGCYLKGAWKDD